MFHIDPIEVGYSGADFVKNGVRYKLPLRGAVLSVTTTTPVHHKASPKDEARCCIGICVARDAQNLHHGKIQLLCRRCFHRTRQWTSPRRQEGTGALRLSALTRRLAQWSDPRRRNMSAFKKVGRVVCMCIIWAAASPLLFTIFRCAHYDVLASTPGQITPL